MKSKKFKISNQNSKFWILICIFAFIILNLKFAYPAIAGEVPKRIVSLAPSITEIIFSLGIGDRLAGVTTYCDYPDEAKKKPKIGGMINPSLEAIVNIKPDIVIMTTDGNTKDVAERLKSLRIQTYTFKARRVSELPDATRDLGRFVGASQRAEELAKDIENGLKQYAGISKNSNKVLFIIWPEPLVVAGPGTAIDDIITLLGFKNAASRAKIPYPKYSIEEIIRQSPDIIFFGKGHTDIEEALSDLLKKISTVPAVRNKHVCYLSDSLYRLGPRITKGIEEMSLCIK